MTYLLELASQTVPYWTKPAIVLLFGIAALGFMLWWDLIFGDDDG